MIAGLPRRALAWLALTWALVALIGAGTAAAAPAPQPAAVQAEVPDPPPELALTALPSAVSQALSAIDKPVSSPTPRPISTPTRTAEAVPTSGPIGEQIVAYARTFFGIPYVWGGTSRSGLDCSGLTYLVLRHFGFTPPRTAATQANWTVRIPADEAQPGDLVFLGSPATHVGIYVGDGRMIDSQTYGTVVAERALFKGAYFGRAPS